MNNRGGKVIAVIGPSFKVEDIQDVGEICRFRSNIDIVAKLAVSGSMTDNTYLVGGGAWGLHVAGVLNCTMVPHDKMSIYRGMERDFPALEPWWNTNMKWEGWKGQEEVISTVGAYKWAVYMCDELWYVARPEDPPCWVSDLAHDAKLRGKKCHNFYETLVRDRGQRGA